MSGGGEEGRWAGHMVIRVSSPNQIKLWRFLQDESYHCRENCVPRMMDSGNHHM